MDINTIVKPLCVDFDENYYSRVIEYLADYEVFAKELGRKSTGKHTKEYNEFERVLTERIQDCKEILTDVEELNSSSAKKKMRKLLYSEINRLGKNAMVSSCSRKGKNNLTLFRGRVDQEAIEHANYNRYEEFFHIPKTKRYLAGAYRFSSPGVPGLYLSSSLLTVFEELEKPIVYNKDNLSSGKDSYFNVVGMNVDVPLVLLDMRLPNLSKLKSRIGHGENFSVESLKRYLANLASLPFKIILHTRINYDSRKVIYKKEYHIPRLLSDILLRERSRSTKRLSAFSELRIVGIHYSSTQVLVDEKLKKECNRVGLRYDPSNIVVFPSIGDYNDYCPDLVRRLFNTKAVLSAQKVGPIIGSKKEITPRQILVIENRLVSEIEEKLY